MASWFFRGSSSSSAPAATPAPTVAAAAPAPTSDTDSLRGPEFLAVLHDRVTRHRERILAGRVQFTLTPQCLAYLNDKLAEYDRDGGRHAEARGGSDRALRYSSVMSSLRDFVREVPRLRVVPDADRSVETAVPIVLRRFRSLRRLELVRCRGYLVEGIAASSLVHLEAHEAVQSMAELLRIPDATSFLEDDSVFNVEEDVGRNRRQQNLNEDGDEDNKEEEEEEEEEEEFWNSDGAIAAGVGDSPGGGEAVAAGSRRRQRRRIAGSDSGSSREVRSGAWCANVEYVNASHNSIPSMDESLLALTSVHELDLSHNELRCIDHLQECVLLERLDLSHNSISTLVDVHLVIGNVAELVLSENRLESTRGLEKLYSLQTLDLRCNFIGALPEVARLSPLPQLSSLFLLGNPIADSPSYRVDVASQFVAGTLMVLDGVPLAAEELVAMRPDMSVRLQRLKVPSAAALLAASEAASGRSSAYDGPVGAPVLGGGAGGGVGGGGGSGRARKTRKMVATIEELPDDGGADGDSLTFVHRTAAVARSLPTGSLLSTSPGAPVRESETARKLMERAETLRGEDGNKWLVVLNHMLDQETPEQARKRTEQAQFELQLAVAKSRAQIRTAKMHKAAKEIKENIGLVSLVTDPSGASATSAAAAEASSPNLLGVGDRSPPAIATSPVQSPNLERPAVATTVTAVAAAAAAAPSAALPAAAAVPRTSGSAAQLPAQVAPEVANNVLRYIKEATAEFMVRLLDSGQERILLIGPTHIVEADPNGRSSRVHEAKYLDDVSWGHKDGSPVVRAVFAAPRADTEGRNDKLVTVGYVMLDEASKVELMDLLRAVVTRNTKSKLICLHCSQVFLRPPGGLERCLECGHEQLILFEGRSGPEAAARPGDQADSAAAGAASAMADSAAGHSGRSDAAGAGSSAAADSDCADPQDEDDRGAEDAAPETMDVNLQLHFRLNVFSGVAPPGESEQFVYFFKSDFIRFGSKVEYAMPSYLLLSNINIYLMVRNRKPTDKDPGFKQLHVIPLNELRRVVRGPNFQYFRLEHLRKGFVYLTRDHRRTHRFIMLLKSTLASRSVAEFTTPVTPVIDALNADVLQKLGAPATRKPGGSFVHAYFLLFHLASNAGASAVTSTSTFSMLSSLAAMTTTSAKQEAMRTFVLTNTHLLLLSENLAKYPAMDGLKGAGTPWFELVDARRLRDVIAVELRANALFDFVFEDEETHTQSRWTLRSETVYERSRLISVVLQLWRAAFHVPFDIFDESQK